MNTMKKPRTLKRIITYLECVLIVAFLALIPAEKPHAQDLSKSEEFKNYSEQLNSIIDEAKNGNDVLVIMRLDEEIKNQPDNPFPYYLKGLIQSYVQGFHKKGIEEINKALSICQKIYSNPEDYEISSTVIKAYRAGTYFNMGDFEKAIDDSSSAIKYAESHSVSHKHPLMYTGRGEYLSAANRYHEAIEDFKRSIEKGSTEKKTFFGLAYCFHQIGDFDKAEYFFKKTDTDPSTTLSGELDKPVSLKTKAFISNRIKAASKYISFPPKMLNDVETNIRLYSDSTKQKNQVIEIQKLLENCGYDPGPIDGVSGPKTYEAICQFQVDHGYPADGVVSESLIRKLTLGLKDKPKQDQPKKLKPILSETHKDVPHLVKQILPAIVEIQGIRNQGGVLGTGFFIAKDLLVTNYHVIDGTKSIKIKTFQGNISTGNVVAKDRSHDLAVLKIKGSNSVYLNLCEKKPEVGEQILVIGNPLGLSQTVSDGIVSAVREFKDLGTSIQITAPISEGSSGGPVINLNGEVIGVATLYFEKGHNLNFAVSTKYIKVMLNKNQKQ